MGEKKLMLGNEAIARGVYEAGVKVASAYPGTPSTEISENLVQYKDSLYCEWAPNEKVAAEVAFGASVAGVRSFACMKMVGFNVAADPVYSMAYTGVNGGMVITVADDPGLYSSQNEQDTRAVCRAAQVPVFEPSDSQEAKDFVKTAYEISEKYDKPVVLRTTTRLAHSQGLVELCDRTENADKPYEKNPAKWVMLPANAIKRHVIVEDEMAALAEAANTLSVNKAEYNDTKIGFITSGIPYTYVKEAMPEASVLKLGLVYPLPKKLIEEFASKVDRIIVFEELMPLIEDQLKAWGIACEGKELFSRIGEYSANMIKEKVLGQKIDAQAAKDIPNRPPILCPGCPHRSTFWVIKKLKLHAAGDIGCYTLGAVPPLSVIETTLCMGSSISSLHGMGKARGKEYLHDWVCVIGDSTFMHTGVNSLMNMVYNQSTGTVIILDNRTTAMTGHQDNPATGVTLMGDTVPAIEFEKFCRGLGIENVFTVDAFDIKALEERLKTEAAADHLSVIIAKAPCALLKSARSKKKCEAIPEKCKHCGACTRPGCPALTKNPDGTISIDDTMCNGCGLCRQLCPFDAIREVNA
ncbi:MAG TPA: indolepyruvate ferredoxin oxidoreductase subunit alpha [Lachnospiraceae bacterium]|nr:indolepyruvate ferredoxin oxidoreductase subunit alpha [Lachnospiraceae bacterium]